MSQSGSISAAQAGTGDLLSLSGNSGGIIPPDSIGDITIFGQDTDFLTVVGNAANNTLEIQVPWTASASFTLAGGDTFSYSQSISPNTAIHERFDILGVSDDFLDLYSATGTVAVVNDGSGAVAFQPFINEQMSSNFEPTVNINTLGNLLVYTIILPGSKNQNWKIRLYRISVS